jgi:MFS family permease
MAHDPSRSTLGPPSNHDRATPELHALHPLRQLLATPTYVRLWSVGACVNAMRWFELLAAALFTFDMTHSVLDVAVVSAARTMPMLVLGAFAGLASDTMDRKRMLVAGQFVTCAGSATIALLGVLGCARPWHVALAALLAGTVWSTEMSTRRRMVGESVARALVPRALAFDTLTNSVARMAGPIAAGVLYQFGGIACAFALSCAVYLLAAIIAMGLRHRQSRRRLVLRRVPRELADGLAYARSHAVISGVLLVTIAMNMLGFSYSALIAPIGWRGFMVSPALIGIMAASESFGAFLCGLWLTGGNPPANGRYMMVGGALIFFGCVALMPVMPVFPLACLMLVVGGAGSAAFASMQAALIVLHAPLVIRARLMGLLTVCIGTGPLGILLVGVLAHVLGPLQAVDVIELTGLLAVIVAGIVWKRNEARAAPMTLRAVMEESA